MTLYQRIFAMNMFNIMKMTNQIAILILLMKTVIRICRVELELRLLADARRAAVRHRAEVDSGTDSIVDDATLEDGYDEGDIGIAVERINMFRVNVDADDRHRNNGCVDVVVYTHQMSEKDGSVVLLWDTGAAKHLFRTEVMALGRRTIGF
jgi:hypothetical protein